MKVRLGILLLALVAVAMLAAGCWTIHVKPGHWVPDDETEAVK